jgi:hypothetical protein
MSEEIFNAASDARQDYVAGEGRQLEVGPGEVHRIGQVLSGVGERAVQIKHDQIDCSLHEARSFSKIDLKPGAVN